MKPLLPLLLCTAWLLLPGTSASAAPVQAPIRSQAELTRYLHDTPLGSTPLAPLTPGGRKRFLAGLVWGSHGLGGLPFDDPDNELTSPQIVRLFALFGMEELAQGRGLSPAERARLEEERAEDARTRGCTAGRCPESTIEQRYDALVLGEDRTKPDAERQDLAVQTYRRLFADAQPPERLRTTSRLDLRLLKRAAEHAVSRAPDAVPLADLEADLAEMQRRGMVRDKDYAGLYRALVAGRRLAAARALALAHPGLGVEALPELLPSSTSPPGQPTALAVAAQGRTMRRQAFDLSAPWQLVVVAACHFSEDAARAIEADAQLKPLFAGHAIWLADQRESFAAAAEWNRRFPDQPIHVAWQDSEWTALDSWAMPTFYLFRHGRLAMRWSGWPADTGMAQLRTHLREAGLLP